MSTVLVVRTLRDGETNAPGVFIKQHLLFVTRFNYIMQIPACSLQRLNLDGFLCLNNIDHFAADKT